MLSNSSAWRCLTTSSLPTMTMFPCARAGSSCENSFYFDFLLSGAICQRGGFAAPAASFFFASAQKRSQKMRLKNQWFLRISFSYTTTAEVSHGAWATDRFFSLFRALRAPILLDDDACDSAGAPTAVWVPVECVDRHDLAPSRLIGSRRCA